MTDLEPESAAQARSHLRELVRERDRELEDMRRKLLSARSLLSRHIKATYPRTRWPCPYCNRKGIEHPLRVMSTKVCGQLQMHACMLCTSEDLNLEIISELDESSVD